MGITLTESAARHIKRYLTEHDNKVAFRVGVKSTGCSGYMYVIEAADEIKEQDHVFESNGIKVIVDPESFNLLAGTELDYTRDGINEGFRFHNPNVQTTCGCGESFNV
ncbi:MAG: iron-sulfur cluster assembly accessory protein [Gammaproteobacteria bacterium]